MMNSFSGKHRFLSNFFPAEVEYEGIVYPTVEHAYQASKTNDVVDKQRIAKLPKSGDAKRAGQRVKMVSNWEVIKLEVMYHSLGRYVLGSL